jgi:hypothetical protein
MELTQQQYCHHMKLLSSAWTSSFLRGVTSNMQAKWEVAGTSLSWSLRCDRQTNLLSRLANYGEKVLVKQLIIIQLNNKSAYLYESRSFAFVIRIVRHFDLHYFGKIFHCTSHVPPNEKFTNGDRVRIFKASLLHKNITFFHLKFALKPSCPRKIPETLKRRKSL